MFCFLLWLLPQISDQRNKMAHMVRASSGLSYPERFYAAASYVGLDGSQSSVKQLSSKFSNDTSLLLYALHQQVRQFDFHRDLVWCCFPYFRNLLQYIWMFVGTNLCRLLDNADSTLSSLLWTSESWYCWFFLAKMRIVVGYFMMMITGFFCHRERIFVFTKLICWVDLFIILEIKMLTILIFFSLDMLTGYSRTLQYSKT